MNITLTAEERNAVVEILADLLICDTPGASRKNVVSKWRKESPRFVDDHLLHRPGEKSHADQMRKKLDAAANVLERLQGAQSKDDCARICQVPVDHSIEERMTKLASALNIPRDEFFEFQSGEASSYFRSVAEDSSLTTDFYLYPSADHALEAGKKYCRTTGEREITLHYWDENGVHMMEDYTARGVKEVAHASA